MVMATAEITNQTDESSGQQYLTFGVLGSRFAINILEVKEIIELNGMTRVPMAGDAIRGVINLRGNVVPVVDLAVRLKNRPVEVDKRSTILVVELNYEDEKQVLGMLVDEVNEIVDVAQAELQLAPDFGVGVRTEFIHRMARIGEQFIIVLDISRVLNIAELSQPLHEPPAILETHS